MDSELILKFLKFSIVGFLGLFVDFGVTYLFREKIKVNQYLANSLGFTSAVISNFLFNKYWTFSDSNPDVMFQFTKFFFISLGGLLISNGIIYLLSQRKVNFYVAKGIAIVIVVFWNFLMNYKYSFA